MGAGIALQCANLFPGIDFWYGGLCSQLEQNTPVVAHPQYARLLFLPVKPLDAARPAYSWAQKACPDLICRGLRQLRAYEGEIALSYVGAGNGRLSERLVADLIHEELGKDDDPSRFLLVEQPKFRL